MTRDGPNFGAVSWKLTTAVPLAMALKLTLATRTFVPETPGTVCPRVIFIVLPEIVSSAEMLKAEPTGSIDTAWSFVLSNVRYAETAVACAPPVFKRISVVKVPLTFTVCEAGTSDIEAFPPDVGALTLTVTDLFTDPPVPVHVKV